MDAPTSVATTPAFPEMELLTMQTVAQLRQALGVAVDALNSEEILLDPKKYEAKSAEIAEQRGLIDRVEKAQKAQSALALPADLAERSKILEVRRPSAGRLRSFTGKTAEEDAYRTGMFIRATMFERPDAAEWCKANGVPITRAASEGVNSAGGVLVPEEMMNAIIVLRETFGIFRQQCRVVPMGRDTLNWPRRTGGLTAYFTAENTAPTESQLTFDNVQLVAKKLAVLTRLSTELEEDAIIAIAEFIVGEVAYAMASKEDDCGFNGDGTSTYGGMRGLTNLAVDGNHNAGKYTAAGGHNTFGTLDATDITGLMGLLPYYALANAKFYISQTGFATTFERLIATAGGNSINTLDGSIVYRYLGFPIVISQKLPTSTASLTTKAMLFFGDLAMAAAMGERRGVTIKRSDQRYFDQDQIGILGTERFDINVHDLGDSTNAGPIVSLVAP